MESAVRLSSLIENILDLTQGEAGALPLHKEPIELAAFVQGRVGKFREEAKAKRIDLVVQIEPTLGEVSGDSRRLCESLDHLLSNALRYTPEGGRVLEIGRASCRERVCQYV